MLFVTKNLEEGKCEMVKFFAFCSEGTGKQWELVDMRLNAEMCGN